MNQPPAHHLKTLEDFDWRLNSSIPRKQIYDLATGQFIRQAADLLLIGPPGAGKTHLAQALGYEAIKLNFQVLYRTRTLGYAGASAIGRF